MPTQRSTKSWQRLNDKIRPYRNESPIPGRCRPESDYSFGNDLVLRPTLHKLLAALIENCTQPSKGLKRNFEVVQIQLPAELVTPLDLGLIDTFYC